MGFLAKRYFSSSQTASSLKLQKCPKSFQVFQIKISIKIMTRNIWLKQSWYSSHTTRTYLNEDFKISFQAKLGIIVVSRTLFKRPNFSVFKEPTPRNASVHFVTNETLGIFFCCFVLTLYIIHSFGYSIFLFLENWSTDKSVTDFFLRSCFLPMQLFLPRGKLKSFSFVMLSTPIFDCFIPFCSQVLYHELWTIAISAVSVQSPTFLCFHRPRRLAANNAADIKR